MPRLSKYTDDEFIGKIFNCLTVLEKTARKSGSAYLWKCQCQCGNITYATKTAIISGHTKSCGCFHLQQRRKLGQSKKKDLTDQRFGDLQVIQETEYRKDGRVM